MNKGTRCRVFQSEILFVSKGIKELNVEELIDLAVDNNSNSVISVVNEIIRQKKHFATKQGLIDYIQSEEKKRQKLIKDKENELNELYNV